MRFLVLNGGPVNGSFNNRLNDFKNTVNDMGHEAVHRDLAIMNINYCTGCWSCWTATPGLCPQKDDMPIIYRDVVSSDILVFASPLLLRNISSVLKKAQDRLVTLIHPYVRLYKGELHHRSRYGHMPKPAAIVETEPGDEEGGITFVRTLMDRFALNLRKPASVFVMESASDFREVLNDMFHH